jgi:predicted nucleotidyltransferase
MSDNPLTALFASKSLVRLLSVLLMNPEKSYYQQQLLRIIGGPLRPLQLALDRAVASGLVIQRRDGRQVYYRAAADHPAFAELRAVFVKTIAVADVLRDALAPLEGIETAFVHGSVASGEQHAGSDIDVFVVGDVGLRQVSAALTEVERTIAREVNVTLYSRDELRAAVRAQNHFIMDVLAKAKIPLIGDPDALGSGAERWPPQATTAEPV